MRKWLIVVACLILVLGIAAWVAAVHLEPAVRARTEHLLGERFDSDVQIGSLYVTLFPIASVTANNIAIRYHQEAASQPIIKIRRLIARTDIPSIFGAVRRIHLVRLEGLEIRIPAGTFHHDQFTRQPDETLSNELRPTQDTGNELPFIVSQISADGALLQILPKKPGANPLEFAIQKLTLQSVGRHRPMAFSATLMNAKPPGLIHTSGEFGPWQKQDPGATRVSGKYRFRDADLGVFKGISGTLSSDGEYRGELDSIEVNGSTDTPNFKVGRGHAVDLKTDFSALVDGTTGDTLLKPVKAHFRNSSFECRGGAESTPGVKGKAVSLSVLSQHARVEDLLDLVLPSKSPLLVGNMTFQSKFLLPQDDVEVLDKLLLNGRFSLTAARFTSPLVQDKVDTLSNRGRGIKKNSAAEQDDVASNFAGRFALNRGTLNLSTVSFSVPGARVNLHGWYGLKSEAMEFHGKIRLQATLSHLANGWKSLLLKPVDPFFKKDGAGAVLPIKITGTKADPHFGLDFHHKDRS